MAPVETEPCKLLPGVTFYHLPLSSCPQLTSRQACPLWTAASMLFESLPFTPGTRVASSSSFEI